jgi:hypothetical protein
MAYKQRTKNISILFRTFKLFFIYLMISDIVRKKIALTKDSKDKIVATKM